MINGDHGKKLFGNIDGEQVPQTTGLFMVEIYQKHDFD
jgi:hypothetical protein